MAPPPRAGAASARGIRGSPHMWTHLGTNPEMPFPERRSRDRATRPPTAPSSDFAAQSGVCSPQGDVGPFRTHGHAGLECPPSTGSTCPRTSPSPPPSPPLAAPCPGPASARLAVYSAPGEPPQVDELTDDDPAALIEELCDAVCERSPLPGPGGARGDREPGPRRLRRRGRQHPGRGPHAARQRSRPGDRRSPAGPAPRASRRRDPRCARSCAGWAAACRSPRS